MDDEDLSPALEMVGNLAGEMAPFGVQRGMIFGHHGLKTSNRKVFCFEHGDAMVFKLDGEAHAEARALEGASEFTPGDSKSMSSWIVVPNEHADRWPDLAHAAHEYVDAG